MLVLRHKYGDHPREEGKKNSCTKWEGEKREERRKEKRTVVGGRSPYFCRKQDWSPRRREQRLPPPRRFFLFCVFACIRHYFPRHTGGGSNCAGAHHGSFTPPRISRSCVQEYHCELTVSWRGSLPKLLWPEWGTALHLIGRPLMRKSSAQVVFAHST